jgi:ATP-dependent 26S proteasome regulatory subunit
MMVKKDNKSIRKYKYKNNKKTKKVSRGVLVDDNLKNKKKTIKQLIKEQKLKEPEKLRVGYVSKEINGKRYIVRLDSNNKKHFAIANKKEIACHLKLRENMNKFVAIYKTGNSPFKNIKGAISFAIRETSREFPDCTTTNGKYNRKIENRTYKRAVYDNYNYYKKYWYYKITNYLKGLKLY